MILLLDDIENIANKIKQKKIQHKKLKLIDTKQYDEFAVNYHRSNQFLNEKHETILRMLNELIY